jgi:hypothetical protein
MNNLVSYQLARAASSGHKLFSAPLPIESNAEEIVRGLEKVYASKGVLCEFDIDPARASTANRATCRNCSATCWKTPSSGPTAACC